MALLIPMAMLGALVTACGSAEMDAEGPGADQTGTTTSASPDPAPTPKTGAAAIDLAQFLLTQGPETAGLTARPNEETAYRSGDPELQKVADYTEACLGTPYNVMPELVQYSDLFTDGNSETPLIAISSSVLFPADQVDDELAAHAHPRYAQCSAELAGQSLARGAQSSGTVSASTSGRTVTVVPALAARVRAEVRSARAIPPLPGTTGGVEATIDLTGPGGTVPIHMMSVEILRGRVESGITLIRPVTPPDPALMNRLTAQVVAKMDKL